jgi:hypothetical protein
LSLEAFSFSLQTLFAYPYSTSLFVTYYEERFTFSVAYFTFHCAHFGRSPFYAIFGALLHIFHGGPYSIALSSSRICCHVLEI